MQNLKRAESCFGPFKRTVYGYKGRVKNIVLKKMYSKKYPALGLFTLFDGVRGSKNFRDGRWLGFFGDDFYAVIDLGGKTKISSVKTGFLQTVRSWIMFPLWVQVSVSNDPAFFSPPVKVYPKTDERAESAIEDFFADIGGIEARYIKIHAKNRGILPAWHANAGNKSWIFIDEINIK